MESTYARRVPITDIVSQASVVVLEEADRCLDVGFQSDIEQIMSSGIEPKKQTLLFSATIPRDLRSMFLETVWTIRTSHMSSSTACPTDGTRTFTA